MRKVAAVLCVVVFANSYAYGGMVEFSKGEFNVSDPGVVTLDVTIIGSDPVGFDTLDLIIGSNNVPITDFAYRIHDPGDPEDPPTFVSLNTPLFNVGFFPFDVFVGGNSPAELAVGPTLLLGTLTVDPTGLGLTEANIGEVLEVFVSFDNDGLSQAHGVGIGFENLSGVGMINVVPEPGTLSLLGLAALGLIRRRRKSA